jgi:hypothetical protein
MVSFQVYANAVVDVPVGAAVGTPVGSVISKLQVVGNQPYMPLLQQ